MIIIKKILFGLLIGAFFSCLHAQKIDSTVFDQTTIGPTPLIFSSSHPDSPREALVCDLPGIPCKISIYSLNGTLVKTISKGWDISSVTWDLKNEKGIPIGTGKYIIYLEVKDVAEKILIFYFVNCNSGLDCF